MALREGAISGDTLANMVDDHSNGANFVGASPDMNIPKLQGFLPAQLFKGMAGGDVVASVDTEVSKPANTVALKI